MYLKTLLFLLICSFSAVAQFPAAAPSNNLKGDGKITGNLVDSTTKAPVEYATIGLYRVSDMTKPIDGTLTDDAGKFTLKDLPNGKFAIKFTSIGFKDKIINVGELTDKNKSIVLENVILNTNAQLLNEVMVTGQAAVIEERVDRLVYNADKDITSKGGDATEILRKVPLLTVDLDGNVQLRGSSNIRVLINNKPSTIMAASVADALKQIPADQIKTVEVITSPSAKYDAEGSGGIINIITKKNNIEGYSLNTDLGVGNRGANLGLNGSLRTGKFGMNIGGYGRWMVNPSATTFEQRTKDIENVFVTRQTGDAKDKMVFGRYTLGADYDISKNKSLSAGARFGTRSFARDQNLQIDRFQNDVAISNTLQNIVSNNPSLNWDFNLDYLHIIKPSKEFSISTLYSRSTANSEFTNTPLNNIDAAAKALTNLNDNLNQEYTAQLDYMTPIKKNQLFEVGVKGIMREVNSSFSYLLGGKAVNDDGRPSGSLDYNQNIGAGYLSYTYSTKSKYTFKAGTRYEYTSIDAVSNNTTAINIPSYGNLVPSLNISKTYGGKYTVKTAYNRRIQRPGLQQLNPNVNQANPQSIQIGNPSLKPEIADNVELSVSASIKKIYLNLSTFGRFTGNSISQISYTSDLDPSKLITTYQNVGQDNAYGFNLFGNLTITPKWMLNGGIESFYNFISGQAAGLNGVSVPVSNQGWNVSGRLMSFVTLNNGWAIQAFSFARGSRVLPMGRQGGFGYYSLGVKKDFKNKKGSIGMSAQNFLANSLKIKSNIETPQFYQNSVNQMFNRGINLNLSYKIGKSGANAMQPRKRAKGVSNDDVKEGGGDSSAQQQPAQSTGRPR